MLPTRLPNTLIFGGCLVLCLVCPPASWRAGGLQLSAGLSDHPFPSPPLAPGIGCWTRSWVLLPGHRLWCVLDLSLPTSLPGLFYFPSCPWEGGAQPVWFVGFLKIIYLWAPRGCFPAGLVIIITTLVTRWQQNTGYFWGQYHPVLFSISYIIIGWMKVCSAINLLFSSRITSRPSWQTWMLMTDLRDFYFTLAFSLINNLMAFFFFFFFFIFLAPKRLWNRITFPNASRSLEFIFCYFILMLVCCCNYCILIDFAKSPSLASSFQVSGFYS